MSLELLLWSDNELYRRHGLLASRDVYGEASAVELAELQQVRAELDRREMARMGPGLDQLEAQAEQYAAMARCLFVEPIRTLLQQRKDLKWSIQGFGMLRAYLSKEDRLHIWHSSGKVDQVSTIHDHPWDFESHVVAGRITDRVYRESLVFARAPTHNKQRIRCGPGGCALAEQCVVRLELIEERTYGPGDTYSRRADELHESVPEDGTITLIKRTFKPDTEHAWVCFPVGTTWVSAEPRVATPEEIELFVGAGLAALDAVK